METKNYILKKDGNVSLELVSNVKDPKLAEKIGLYIKDTVQFLSGLEHDGDKAWEEFLKNVEPMEA